VVDTEAVQQAYDAAIAGDPDPLVDLLHPDLNWSGLERGHLWWRKAPG
jgi:ketosteroid isomerase-like protein